MRRLGCRMVRSCPAMRRRDERCTRRCGLRCRHSWQDPSLASVMAALPEARVVGGAVRDALAEREITDIDLATPRTPEQVTQALRAAGFVPCRPGLDHGTVTAVAGRARLRDHHAAARCRDRWPPCPRGLHR